jgi:hypothetical protein
MTRQTNFAANFIGTPHVTTSSSTSKTEKALANTYDVAATNTIPYDTAVANITFTQPGQNCLVCTELRCWNGNEICSFDSRNAYGEPQCPFSGLQQYLARESREEK